LTSHNKSIRTLLIDADILVYKAAFSAEENIQWDEETWTTTANIEKGRDSLDQLVSDMCISLGTSQVIMCMTAPNNWRKDILPSYKEQRKATRKPVLIKPLMQYIRDTYVTYERPTLEADDVLGILATAQVITGEKVVCSIDKDLLQIPGQHWNIDKKALTVVTEEAGIRLHLRQTLTGDPVDNYTGLPGCGPVKADKILSDLPDVPSMWAAIVAAYEKKGLTEDDALVQARVARICQARDYDFKNKAVRLWTPSSPPLKEVA